MRSSLCCSLLLVLLAACGEREPRPSILLITLDTTRADRLGCYGRPAAGTPHLDALAARGTRFDRAYTTAPITLPAHASILTGTEPVRHGVRDNGSFELGDDLLTLAEHLREHGWSTGAFIAAYPVHATFGLDRGFELYDDELPKQDGPAGPSFGERRAEDVVRLALDWIDSQDENEPWLAWLHLFDPHAPYAPPHPFAARWRADPYQGEVAYVDHCLGELFEQLEASGRLETSIVAVVADHGEGLGEHGEDTHAFLLHEATVRVPWLLAGPNVPAELTLSSVVSTIDVAPTLLDLAGVEPLASAQGRSLRPLLEGATGPARAASLETWYPRLRRGWSELAGRVEGSTKVVVAPSSGSPPEAYDLTRDPAELHPFVPESGDAGEVLERLTAALARRTPPPLAPPLDPEVQRHLERLGYSGPGGGTGEEARPHPRERLPVLQKLAEVQRSIGAGRFEAAAALLDHLEAIAPDELGVHLNRGRLYRAQAESDPAALDAAAEAFERVLKLQPAHRHAWWALAEVEALRGNESAAEAARRAAEELGPALDR